MCVDFFSIADLMLCCGVFGFILLQLGVLNISATKFLDRLMTVYPKSSPSSEGLLIGRLKERKATDVLKHNSYLVETYLTLCGATIVSTGTSGPRRGRVGRLSQLSGIETLRSVKKEARQNWVGGVFNAFHTLRKKRDRIEQVAY